MFSVIFVDYIWGPLCLIFCHLQPTQIYPAQLSHGPCGSASKYFVPVQRGIEWGALFEYDQRWRIYLHLVCDWVHQDCSGGWRGCVPSTSRSVCAKKKRLHAFQDKWRNVFAWICKDNGNCHEVCCRSLLVRFQLWERLQMEQIVKLSWHSIWEWNSWSISL